MRVKRTRSSSSPSTVAHVLRQAIGARTLWAPAVGAKGCTVRLDRARQGRQPGAPVAVEASEGSQSWVLGRCLRQSHSLHTLPSLACTQTG